MTNRGTHGRRKAPYNAVDAEVFVVRDEYILSNTASGKVIPLVEDGKRVAKGDVVAMVFRNDEEAANYLRVRELDSQISHYQQLAKHLSSASDINALNEEAFSILLDSLDTAGSGQFSKFGDRMEELGDLMTNFSASTGKAKSKKTFNISAIVAAALKNDDRPFSITGDLCTLLIKSCLCCTCRCFLTDRQRTGCYISCICLCCYIRCFLGCYNNWFLL